MEQPAVSHQLRVLRDLGLVVGNRNGRHVVYDLFDSHVAALIDEALRHIEHVAHDGVRVPAGLGLTAGLGLGLGLASGE
jgi:DNA-binding transcriptional ArsR family regulator